MGSRLPHTCAPSRQKLEADRKREETKESLRQDFALAADAMQGFIKDTCLLVAASSSDSPQSGNMQYHHACVCVPASVYACACLHACMRVRACTCVCVCVPASVYACACLHVCMRLRACMRVCVCVPACVYAWGVHAQIHTRAHICMQHAA